MRSEEEIFADLLGLCGSPGYVHALAMLCFRDNYIRYRHEIKPKDMDQLFSRSRLIRTEITTLIGLLIRKQIDFSHPGFDFLQSYMDRTEAVLEELHHSMRAVMFGSMLGSDGTLQPPASPDLSGAAMREPIVYGGESAYGFQYRDLAEKEYGPYALGCMNVGIKQLTLERLMLA